MKTILLSLTLLSTALLPAHSEDAPAFFVFDNALTSIPTLQGKAELLAKLGYDGIGWRPGKTAEMLTELDKHGLKMNSTYVVLKATGKDCAIPAPLIAEIKALKGRDTLISLVVQGKSEHKIVVPALRRLADIAKSCDLKVALYPHTGCYTDTDAHCLHLAKLGARPNLGVGFNLCHFLKQNDASALEKTLRNAAPHLLCVSINGADQGNTREMTWKRLIQPLGSGTFDTRKVVQLLDEIGYRGPVGLQCYNIKAPPTEHLAQSMKAWQALTSSSDGP